MIFYWFSEHECSLGTNSLTVSISPDIQVKRVGKLHAKYKMNNSVVIFDGVSSLWWWRYYQNHFMLPTVAWILIYQIYWASVQSIEPQINALLPQCHVQREAFAVDFSTPTAQYLEEIYIWNLNFKCDDNMAISPAYIEQQPVRPPNIHAHGWDAHARLWSNPPHQAFIYIHCVARTDHPHLDPNHQITDGRKLLNWEGGILEKDGGKLQT